MPQRLRIFISSPADVPDERLRADLIIDKLSLDYSRFFAIESYRWEHEAMLASAHFQDAIEPPSAFDIVVLILWSRLGTPLPEKTLAREYRGIDGRAPVTGTEWEYEEALKVAREKKAPDLLAFRNVSPAQIDPRDPAAQAQSMGQLAALNEFWRRHFADQGVFLAAYDEYRTLEEFAQRLEESLRALIERKIKGAAAGETRAEPVWLGDPFRGLESYEFDHAPIFFGRDAAIAKATEQLAANARAGRAFLLVSGASGSGKSSLVKAGIVPRLMKPQRISGVAFIRRVVFRLGSEGSDVFLSLANALARAGTQDVGLLELMAFGQDPTQLAAHLRGASAEPGYLFANALGRLTESERKSGRLLGFEDAKLILVVDQLEELFTLPGIAPEQRRRFIQLLDGLARSGAVWIIATLRADFWHRAADIPELIALAEGQGRIDLAAPSAAELAEMIRKPAQVAGLSFEPHPDSGLGLDAVLAEDASAAPGALPLLSFTLDELYRSAKARGEAVLTHASYEALGGLEGAIAKRADDMMASLPLAAQSALPRVLRALTTVTDAAEQVPVARPAALASFPQGRTPRTLIDAFVAGRLLVATDEGDAGATVRLAHEALIGRWQRARDQLAADRRDLETRTHIERQFGRWRNARGLARRLLLLRNPDLANAVDLGNRWGDGLDAALRDFIKRSARHARFAQTLTAAAAALFAIVAGAAIYAERQSVRAQKEAEQRQINLLAELATSEQLRGNLDTALRLGVFAAENAVGMKEDDVGVSAARAELARAVWETRWRLALGAHDKWIASALFSPDGKRAVTASGDGTARIWDAETGKEIAVLRGHADELYYAAFSPDGSRIVTASYDRTARIWDANANKLVTVLRGHQRAVNSAVFDPNGSRVVTASSDGTARVWDAGTGDLLVVLGRSWPANSSISSSSESGAVWSGAVWSAAFSPDGKRIVTASADHTARIWDAQSGDEIMVLRGHFGAVVSASFSPDGGRIITAAGDKTARIWDAITGKQIAIFRANDAPFSYAAFTADGKRIVTADGGRAEIIDATGKRTEIAGNENSARIWDADTGQLITVLRGHRGALSTAAVSPDGTRIITASWDKTARIWDCCIANEVTVLYGHDRPINFAAFSPDGKRVVTGSRDDTARIWDSATAKQIEILSGHSKSVNSVAYSPDGSLIVTASQDTTARIWDAKTGKQVAVLRGHTRGVTSAVFSPSGKEVVTSSDDTTARIWDTMTGEPITILRGHAVGLLSAAFSPDGKRVVTASIDGTARIWNVGSGQQIALLDGHGTVQLSAAYSPSGALIITVPQDYAPRIWNAVTAKEIAVLGDRGVNTATFNQDGSRVLTASGEATRIWDTATTKVIASLPKAGQATFNAEGTRIVEAPSSSEDHAARIQDVHFATMSASDLIAEVCNRRLRGLTTLSRDEMNLAGYPDSAPPLDVCAGSVHPRTASAPISTTRPDTVAEPDRRHLPARR